MRKTLLRASGRFERSSLQAVVFDMDGVIVDSHPAHRFAWREFLRMFGKEVTDSELDFVMDGRKREDILLHYLGPLTATQLEEYGRLKNDLFWRAAPEVILIPGVLGFMETIRSAGITMAVATSASAGRTHSILSRTGLLTHFRTVVTAEDVRKGKPDPYIYHLACQRIGCRPESAVAVEDAASGIRAAKSAGMKCVGIAGRTSADHLIAAGADFVLQDFVNVSLRTLHSLFSLACSPRPAAGECNN